MTLTEVNNQKLAEVTALLATERAERDRLHANDRGNTKAFIDVLKRINGLLQTQTALIRLK